MSQRHLQAIVTLQSVLRACKRQIAANHTNLLGDSQIGESEKLMARIDKALASTTPRALAPHRDRAAYMREYRKRRASKPIAPNTKE